ncbi:MAG: AAA family ATPase [Desulfovibrionaceae bacterium]
MLEYLRIRNFGLIENIEMEFTDGLTVLTGESGAGKSFIIKALSFLMAQKFSSDIIRFGTEKSSVEAMFSTSQGELVLRREMLSSTGRSRFFINDTLSSKESILRLQNTLLLNTGQHSQQKLLQHSFQSQLLDTFINESNLLQEKDFLLQELRILHKKKMRIKEKFEQLTQRRDLLEYQQKEIELVSPIENEEEELEEIKRHYKTFEHITENIEKGYTLLHSHSEHSLLDQIENIHSIIIILARTEQDFEEDISIIENTILYFKELARKIQRPTPSLPKYDIESIEARLYQLAQLKRKLHRNLNEICLLKKEIEENLSFLDSCQLDIIHLNKEEEKLKEALSFCLNSLNTKRRDGAIILAEKIRNALLPLGFSEHCEVIFSFTSQEIWEQCFEDKARLVWCQNPGHPPMPLENIASGGELSRFLLAITNILSSSELPTLIFDEVDTGIGGNTLKSVALAIAALAEQRQILLITHWKQTAMHAKQHFLIKKHVTQETTVTAVTLLNKKQRVEELQRMTAE